MGATQTQKIGSSKRFPRRAQLVAEAVSVLCPYCGDVQPNRDGSEMWTREDFARLAASHTERRECVSCEEMMLISSNSNAQFV